MLAVAAARPHAAAGDCGLPGTTPLWIDYAGHDAPIVPKPGMILAVSSGTVVPAQMRAAGAATIMFDLNLNKRVGTTSAPADPATIPDKAKRLFDFAVSGHRLRPPADRRERALRRANADAVEHDERRSTARTCCCSCRSSPTLGATPAITIANPPYTGGEAADWWREAAKAAILIRQVYFTSPGPKGLYKLGPERASRSMRKGMRGLISRFSEIGIPAGRVALELQFQSAAGQGGRQGLQPRSAWLEFVKLETLAAKQVAAETKIQGVWSWGWPSFSVAGNDPDKGAAACVYLWTRDAKLCDGPKLAGVAFNTSLTEGQISLPAGVRCTLGTNTILKADVGRTAALTGDLGSAASALLQRAVLRAQVPVDPATVLAAERAIIRDRFGGSGSRYRSALAALHLSVRDARAIVADRLARDLVETRFRPKPPSSSEVAEFLTTYAGTRVRLVTASPDAPWLGGVGRGLAIETIAPEEVFTLRQGKQRQIDTLDGRFRVRPLGPALPLYALAPSSAVNVARAVLGRFAKDAVYDRWLGTQQQAMLANAVCARDDVPSTGDIDLTAWAPFLGA